MQVKDIMTTEVITVHKETTIKEVARLLIEHRISGLPVVDEEKRLIGVVTEGDLIYADKKLHAPAFTEILGGVIFFENPKQMGEDLQKMTAYKVSGIMTTEVFSVREDAAVEDAATIMVEKGINRVPVVTKDKTLVGIVSRQDIIRSMV
ncbi:MAG: CBS domain-containing protein [Firmicutes bacterium]|nr:CBS domain-containing protein [Bacillota bacterium]